MHLAAARWGTCGTKIALPDEAKLEIAPLMRARSLFPMIAALWFAEMTQAFGTAMIYAALKALIAYFKDPVLVGWAITTYLLVGAGAAAMAERLGDLFGRRRVCSHCSERASWAR